MKPENLIKIDSGLLRESINTFNIPRWWVAERVGVHRRTLGRWLSGEVSHIRESNAKALADCLKIDLHQLQCQKTSLNEATPFERLSGFNAANKSSTVHLFANEHKWQDYIAILTGTINQAAKRRPLCQSYLNLAYSHTQCSNLTTASKYLEHALEIANELQDSDLLIQAYLFKCQLWLKTGSLDQAENSVDMATPIINSSGSKLAIKALVLKAECLFQKGFLEDASQILCYLLDPKNSHKLNDLKKHQILARLGLCLEDKEDLDLACLKYMESAKIAKKAKYTAGENLSLLSAAATLCQMKKFDAARDIASQAIQNKEEDCAYFDEKYTYYKFHLHFNEGNLESAQTHLKTMAEFYKDMPFYLAGVYSNVAKVWDKQKEIRKSKKYKLRAINLFRSIGAENRASWLLEP